jgi:hypothetical protein
MPKFKHYGTVNDKGDLIFDYPGIFHKCKMELKGKKFAMILEENIGKYSLGQLNYFVGIIIKKYCVNNLQFGDTEQDKIIDYFLDRIFGEDYEFHIKGKSIVRRCNPTLSQLNGKQLHYLIETTIALLALEFGIVVEETDKYKK